MTSGASLLFDAKIDTICHPDNSIKLTFRRQVSLYFIHTMLYPEDKKNTIYSIDIDLFYDFFNHTLCVQNIIYPM